MINKISYKLILAVGLVTVTIIGIFAYVLIDSQSKALISQIEQNAHQLSETVKSSTKYDMLINQRESVHRIIETIGKQDGIEKVRIFNKEGEIIFSSDKGETGSLVDKQAEACYACHAAGRPLEKLPITERSRIFTVNNGVRNLGIINPIYNEPDCWEGDCHAHEASQKVLGVLDITMSLEDVDHQISIDQIKMILFAISAIIAISFILWFFVQRLVGNPVNQLVKATSTVAKGDFDYRIKVNKNDELGYLAKSFNEMTQKLSETQRQLYQSDKLASLGRMAAGVAHEINNPLTGVLTYSSYLLKHAELDEKIKEDIKVIVRETKRCREIVKGLLDFSRQVKPKKTTVNINEVINQALSLVEHQLSINNIAVNKKLKENLPMLKADANQMQQVFINLLVNATDAIGNQEGDIFLTTNLKNSEDKNYVEIKISDTGLLAAAFQRRA